MAWMPSSSRPNSFQLHRKFGDPESTKEVHLVLNSEMTKGFLLKSLGSIVQFSSYLHGFIPCFPKIKSNVLYPKCTLLFIKNLIFIFVFIMQPLSRGLTPNCHSCHYTLHITIILIYNVRVVGVEHKVRITYADIVPSFVSCGALV